MTSSNNKWNFKTSFKLFRSHRHLVVYNWCGLCAWITSFHQISNQPVCVVYVSIILNRMKGKELLWFGWPVGHKLSTEHSKQLTDWLWISHSVKSIIKMPNSIFYPFCSLFTLIIIAHKCKSLRIRRHMA